MSKSPNAKEPRKSPKRIPLNMRSTRELRDKLERAAAASGRSLVGEVEHRLERSFWQDTILRQSPFIPGLAIPPRPEGEGWVLGITKAPHQNCEYEWYKPGASEVDAK